MKVVIELNETDLKKLVVAEIERQTGQSTEISMIQIQVKSKQNYKSQWETAEFKAIYSKVD